MSGCGQEKARLIFAWASVRVCPLNGRRGGCCSHLRFTSRGLDAVRASSETRPHPHLPRCRTDLGSLGVEPCRESARERSWRASGRARRRRRGRTFVGRRAPRRFALVKRCRMGSCLRRSAACSPAARLSARRCLYPPLARTRRIGRTRMGPVFENLPERPDPSAGGAGLRLRDPPPGRAPRERPGTGGSRGRLER